MLDWQLEQLAKHVPWKLSSMISDRSRRSLLLDCRTMHHGALGKYNGETSQSRLRLLHLGVQLSTTSTPRFHHGSDQDADILPVARLQLWASLQRAHIAACHSVFEQNCMLILHETSRLKNSWLPANGTHVL